MLLTFLPQGTVKATEDNLGWEQTISPLLKQNLWESDTAYDASHFLMVPLHAAFWLQKVQWQKDFHHHFENFLFHSKKLPSGLEGRLTRLQYLFLASRYLVLAQESAPKELAKFLCSEITRFWQLEPAWQWQQQPFANGIRERITWKLEHKATNPSYLRAIIDEELFLIGISANIKTYFDQDETPTPPDINEILDVARKIFKDQIFWNKSGGWVLQPGVWTDHRDYVYAGHEKISQGMSQYPVPGISWDSSHSSRLPLLLLSLVDASKFQFDDHQYYKKLLRTLARQFFEVVLVPPSEHTPFYRVTNFMDGRNGLYRVAYNPRMNGNGYAPYALSGTPLIGWWAFLSDPRVPKLYENYLSNLDAMLTWLAKTDPYGPKSWTFREHYQKAIPVILNLAIKIGQL
jgi:hypothetical protein